MDAKNRQAATGDQERHQCQLLSEGLMEEIDRRAAQAAFICNKCGARAKSSRHLCQPRACRP